MVIVIVMMMTMTMTMSTVMMAVDGGVAMRFELEPPLPRAMPMQSVAGCWSRLQTVVYCQSAVRSCNTNNVRQQDQRGRNAAGTCANDIRHDAW
jgi:hypothetical protein